MNGEDTPIAEEYIPPSEVASPPQSDPQPLGPPQAFEFSGPDRLRLDVRNNLSTMFVHVHYRMRTPSGLIKAGKHTVGSLNAFADYSSEFDIGIGYLQNVTIYVAGALTFPGQCYARLHVIRGQGAATSLVGTLAQGWLTGEHFLSWPGGLMGRPDEVRPPARWSFGTDPAAGAQITEAVPWGLAWELLSFTARLTTDATAGTREAALFFDPSVGSTYWVARLKHATTVGPSSGNVYHWLADAAIDDTTAIASRIGPIPAGFDLQGGSTIRTSVSGMAAGDQWSEVRYVFRERMELET